MLVQKLIIIEIIIYVHKDGDPILIGGYVGSNLVIAIKLII